MSWRNVSDGWTEYHDSASPWGFRVMPDRPELGLFFFAAGSAHPAAPTLRLLPPRARNAEPGEPTVPSEASARMFPELDETYFRGTDCIANMPQDANCPFGIQVRHRVVYATGESIAVETVLALVTDLLDSHPTVDLVSDHPAAPVSEVIPSDLGGDPVLPAASNRLSTPPPHATRIQVPHLSAPAVLMLPPSDAAAAACVTAAEPIRYRLLAEFLEKGVIRKARFWTCQWTVTPAAEAISRAYAELCSQPLPLTP